MNRTVLRSVHPVNIAAVMDTTNGTRACVVRDSQTNRKVRAGSGGEVSLADPLSVGAIPNVKRIEFVGDDVVTDRQPSAVMAAPLAAGNY